MKNQPEIDQNDSQHKIIISWEEFEKLCSIQATEIEIAEWFGCTVETIKHKVKEHYKLTFFQVHKKKASKGKISLRRLQYQSAAGEMTEDGKDYLRAPNITMQIWLGKQWLSQSDKSELTGAGGGPVEVVEIVHNITMKNKKKNG